MMIASLARSCGGSSSRRRLGWSPMGWPTQQLRCFRATPAAQMLLRSTAAAKCPSIAEPTAPRTTLDAEADGVAVGHSPAEENQQQQHLSHAGFAEEVSNEEEATTGITRTTDTTSSPSVDSHVAAECAAEGSDVEPEQPIEVEGQQATTTRKEREDHHGEEDDVGAHEAEEKEEEKAQAKEELLAAKMVDLDALMSGARSAATDLIESLQTEEADLEAAVSVTMAKHNQNNNARDSSPFAPFVGPDALFPRRVTAEEKYATGKNSRWSYAPPSSSSNDCGDGETEGKWVMKTVAENAEEEVTADGSTPSASLQLIDNKRLFAHRLVASTARDVSEVGPSSSSCSSSSPTLRVKSSPSAFAVATSTSVVPSSRSRPRSSASSCHGDGNVTKETARAGNRRDNQSAVAASSHTAPRCPSNWMDISERQLLFDLVYKQVLDASSKQKEGKPLVKHLPWAKIHASFNARAKCSSTGGVNDTPLMRPRSEKQLFNAFNNRKLFKSRKPSTEWSIEQKELAARIEEIDNLLFARRRSSSVQDATTDDNGGDVAPTATLRVKSSPVVAPPKRSVPSSSARAPSSGNRQANRSTAAAGKPNWMNIAERQLLFGVVLNELASFSAKGNKNQKKRLQWAKIHASYNARVHSSSSNRETDGVRRIRPHSQKQLFVAFQNRKLFKSRKPRTQWTREQKELASRIEEIDNLLFARRRSSSARAPFSGNRQANRSTAAAGKPNWMNIAERQLLFSLLYKQVLDASSKLKEGKPLLKHLPWAKIHASFNARAKCSSTGGVNGTPLLRPRSEKQLLNAVTNRKLLKTQKPRTRSTIEQKELAARIEEIDNLLADGPNLMNNLERQLLFSLVLKELASSSAKGNKKGTRQGIAWAKIHASFNARAKCSSNRYRGADDARSIRTHSQKQLFAAFRNRKQLVRLWSQKPLTQWTREQKDLAAQFKKIDKLVIARGRANWMNNPERQLLFGLALKELASSSSKGNKKQLQWVNIHTLFNQRVNRSSNLRAVGVRRIRPHSQKQLLAAFDNRKQLVRLWSQKPLTQWTREQKDLAAQIKEIDKLVANWMNIAERKLLFSLALKELASSSSKGNKNVNNLKWAKIHASFNARAKCSSNRYRGADDARSIRTRSQKQLCDAFINRKTFVRVWSQKPRTQWTRVQKELVAQIKKIGKLVADRVRDVVMKNSERQLLFSLVLKELASSSSVKRLKWAKIHTSFNARAKCSSNLRAVGVRRIRPRSQKQLLTAFKNKTQLKSQKPRTQWTHEQKELAAQIKKIDELYARRRRRS